VKAFPAATAALALAACVPASPYQEQPNSRPVGELRQTDFVASNGQTYSSSGYIEMFEPNYYVIIGAPDGRPLAGDFDGAALAASQAVRRFDCSNGTELRPGSQFSEAANQWLVVVDCRGSGRSLTGS